MLSRVADSLYWMARYMERAENLARLMLASTELLLDGENTGVVNLHRYWDPVLTATDMEAAFQTRYPSGSGDVGHFMTLDEGNADSIFMCLRIARENARTVRDQVSDEMWSELNDLYLFFASGGAADLYRRSTVGLYDRIIRSSLLFHGITNATLSRSVGWYFILLGKYLERAEKTSRFLDIGGQTGTGELDSIQWASILRSASAFGAYRTAFGSEINADGVINLLLLSTQFPRSVRFCVREVDEALHAISSTTVGTFENEAERGAGRLLAQLNFSSARDIRQHGLHGFIDGIQSTLNEIGTGIFETYVLLPQDTERVTFAPSGLQQHHQRIAREQQMQQQQ